MSFPHAAATVEHSEMKSWTPMGGELPQLWK
ncbi:hypothetical protein CHAN_07880 [Corynebacterium hansenii]|nr:hypothetical protein CHAN_07880 [Corynebacterium hansenii]